MYRKHKKYRTPVTVNDSVEGETIENRIERLLNNRDEVIESKELTYARPEMGVIPNTNVRYDKWDDWAEEGAEIANKFEGLKAIKTEKKEAKTEENGKAEGSDGDQAKTAD